MLHKTLIAAALLLPTSLAFAADHADSPAASAEPTADIADVFAWMSDDAQTLNVVLTVAPFNGAAEFSDAVAYTVHMNSSAGYGEAQTETTATCLFYDTDAIECWVGDQYVEGDPSAALGISTEAGDVRVFAGLRNDPFFFNQTGFVAVVETVRSVAGDLTFDADFCPELDEATSTALVTQLGSGADGAAAVDDVAGTNVLALVLSIDADLVNAGGPLLGVWASTHTVSE